jgi:hypothetical protein
MTRRAAEGAQWLCQGRWPGNPGDEHLVVIKTHIWYVVIVIKTQVAVAQSVVELAAVPGI